MWTVPSPPQAITVSKPLRAALAACSAADSALAGDHEILDPGFGEETLRQPQVAPTPLRTHPRVRVEDERRFTNPVRLDACGQLVQECQ